MSIKRFVLQFFIALTLMPILGNVVSNDIYPLLQKYTSARTRLLIIIPLIAVNCVIFVIYKAKRRKCLLLDPEANHRPHSRVVGLMDPEVRRMVDCYAKEREGVVTHDDTITTTFSTDLPEQPLLTELQSTLSLAGSGVLYSKFNISLKTGSSDIDFLTSQITEWMTKAQKIDPNCTLRFGSFAVLKFEDGGLKWWRLQKERTPTIPHISNSSWNLLNKLRGFLTTTGFEEPNPPAGVKQLNDSVWELYSPEGRVPEMDIVFFHGLQLTDFKDAFWKTWLRGEEELIWPPKCRSWKFPFWKTGLTREDAELLWPQWLSGRFPGARILLISYNFSATQPNALDLHTLEYNLGKDMIQCNVGTRPVIFVGHSLGGIVIKLVLLSVLKERDGLNPNKDIIRKAFLDNVKGVLYYATPHGSSEKIADLANRIPGANPILSLLKTVAAKTPTINEEFRKQRDKFKFNVPTLSMVECLPVSEFGFEGVVVDGESARHDIDQWYHAWDSNHFSICRLRRWGDRLVRLNYFICQKLAGYPWVPWVPQRMPPEILPTKMMGSTMGSAIRRRQSS